MDLVRYELQERILTVTLNRPEKKNAVSTAVLESLGCVLDRFRSDESVRVVLLKGEGGCFCAGADLRELAGFDAAAMRAFHDLREKVFLDLETFPRPTVGVINGFALGTGLELALCTDFRIAADTAFLGIPSTRLGVTESYHYLARLVRCVGVSRARFLVFSGERVPASEARDFGLVERVFPESELEQAARRLAASLAEKAPRSLQRSKRVLSECARDPFLEHVPDPARPLVESLEHREMEEGVQAFVEKRSPEFDR